MLILVTGSTGFVGSQLCRALRARGHRVRAFHRPTSSLRGLEGIDVERAAGDITDLDSLRAAMSGVEAVFHAAAQLDSTADVKRMYRVNIEGTRAVMQAALEAGVRRVVHTSSVAALGIPEAGPLRQKEAGIPLLDENHTWNYRPEYWPYGYTKYMAELEVQKAAAQGLEAVIVNPGYVVGAGDIYRKSTSVLLQIAHGRIPASIPGGLNVVHIADVIDGHLAALESGCPGERYILGGQNMTHTHFLQLAAEAAGTVPPRLVLPARVARSLAGLVKASSAFVKLPVNGELLRLAGYYFYYDTRKAAQAFGLGAARPVEAGLGEAYAWFAGEE